MKAAPESPYRPKLNDPFSSHRRIIDLTRSLPGVRRILDVGCGPGYTGASLAAMGYVVIGIDDRADICRLRALGYDTAFQLDIERDPVPPMAAFDLIIFGDILEHLRDPAQVLARLRPVLVPGGRIIVSVPNVAHWTVRLALLAGYFPACNRGILDRSHLRFFTFDSACRLVEAADFRIERTEVTPIPLPLLWEATAEGRPFAVLHMLNAWITRSWKRVLGYQILILASLATRGDRRSLPGGPSN